MKPASYMHLMRIGKFDPAKLPRRDLSRDKFSGSKMAFPFQVERIGTESAISQIEESLGGEDFRRIGFN